MPNIYVNVDHDVDVYDFLSSCDKNEIQEVVEWLEDGDYIHNNDDEKRIPLNSQNISDKEWYSLTDKFSRIRLQLNLEDEKIIRDILNKYY
jgi:restriction endonuclease